MRSGKAVLVRDDYCDGLGNCLPACPAGAITIEEREAAAFDEAAVAANAARTAEAGGCPGSRARTEVSGELRQWPVQIKLAPITAPYVQDAPLLIAADCAAYARASFHADFMRGCVTLIGCPKLDNADYAEKLAAIIARNEVKSVCAARMEVPCCGGIERAVAEAVRASGKRIPCRTVTLSIAGEILDS
jgi:ferredoxin